MKTKFKIVLGHIPIRSQAEECYGQEVYESCYAYARHHGLLGKDDPIPGYVTVYPDTASATFQQIITEVESGQLDYLVIYSVKQLGAEASTMFALFESLAKNGITICTAENRVTNETSVGKFQLYMLAALAEIERRTIVKSSYELKREAEHAEELESQLDEKIQLVMSLSKYEQR